MNRDPKQGPKQNQQQVESVPPDDDLLMSLVESALACPPDEREAFTRSACGDAETFSHVWKYVEREQKLGGFLQDPLFRPNIPEAPFEPTQLLEDRFLVLNEIARGGMGIVYDGFDEKLKRRIAIKCARAGFGRSLPPEVRHASDISHPNVCKIYDIHTAHTSRGDIDFITMEYLDGMTLTERLSREQSKGGRSSQPSSDATSIGPIPISKPRKATGQPDSPAPRFSLVDLDRFKTVALPRAEAMSIGRQLAAGLAAAHQTGLVHGDLKSNNVILTDVGSAAESVRAVITDFGLARRPGATDPEGRSAQVGGAPDYMAPELLKGGKPSTATDVYALGVLLYELMTGRRPFPPNLSWEKRLRLVPAPAHSPWDKIIASCLEPDPARRPANATIVLEALTPKRGRLWQAAAAAVFVVGAVAIVWGYRIANAPEETVRLAVLPIEAPADLTGEAGRVAKTMSERIRGLSGGPRIDFAMLELASAVDTPAEARAAAATHTLSTQLTEKDGQIVVNALLRDVATGTKVENWGAAYRPNEIGYAPAALAGFVTAALHMPSSSVALMNAGAQKDYEEAVALLPFRSKLDRAVELLDRAILMDPESTLVHAKRGEAQWLKFGRTTESVWLDRARESARQAEMRAPDLAAVHQLSGLLLARSGQYDQAVARYQRAIELEPSNGEAYRRLGAVYQRKGQPDLAKAMLDKAVSADPYNFLAWWERGLAYSRLGDYESAASNYLKSITLAPEEAGPRAELAQAYLNAGRLIEAEAAAREAIDRERSGRSLEILGEILIYQSKELQALPFLLEATKIRPKSVYYLYLGVAYRRASNPTAAETANRTALQLARTELGRDYRDGGARATLAYLASQLGDSQTALNEISQALELASADQDTLFLGALTYEALGLRDRTLALLANAPRGFLGDVGRWPDFLAGLAQDPRFLKLRDQK